MYKVIIVDDEMLVRIGMTSLIQWEDHGFEVVGTASDGLQACQLIERHMPDIVLTDIVMPELNGLELIAATRQKYPFIRFIVLSSHSDYAYVREAMKLGAEDYILKASVKPAEMIRLLETTTAKMGISPALPETGKSAGRTTDRETMIRLLGGGAIDEAEREGWFAERGDALHDWLILVIKAHGPEEETANIGMESALLHLTDAYFSGSCEHVALYKSGEYMALISVPRSDADLEPAASDAAPLLLAVRRYLNVEVSIGMSGRFAGPAAFKAAFVQAKEALQYGFYCGLGQCYRYDPAFFPSIGNGSLFDKKDEERLEHCVETGAYDGLEPLIASIFAKLSMNRYYRNQDIGMFMEIVHAVKRIGTRQGVEWERVYPGDTPIHIELLRLRTIADMQGWFTALIGSFSQQLLKFNGEKYREEVRRLIGYLKTNYAQDISLNGAAAIANMSPSYLSSIFKRETNKSFVEFLTEIRMEKAAELLIQTDLPSYLIAEQVGYENINYFGRAFKKEMGVSPSQYRMNRSNTKK
ncbi:response regulator transcription factor [Paenibacillus thalictri]|uniref:Response regulator n=1 Tax=Paenibacillus thalictri TaxID=2527873 RepID=A0A4Q9DRH1_9BACL|nr:response regulator [Paenibacillus thalictri]TBL79359.1 response regulator [Paenibacillus thalictri]